VLVAARHGAGGGRRRRAQHVARARRGRAHGAHGGHGPCPRGGCPARARRSLVGLALSLASLPLSVGGTASPLTAGLAACSLFVYVLVYTPMKRSEPVGAGGGGGARRYARAARLHGGGARLRAHRAWRCSRWPSSGSCRTSWPSPSTGSATTCARATACMSAVRGPAGVARLRAGAGVDRGHGGHGRGAVAPGRGRPRSTRLAAAAAWRVVHGGAGAASGCACRAGRWRHRGAGRAACSSRASCTSPLLFGALGRRSGAALVREAAHVRRRCRHRQNARRLGATRGCSASSWARRR
jgi:hypothetical protein